MKKGKVFLVHGMKTHRGSRGVAPFILNFSTRWRWMVNFPPRLLYLWERGLIEYEAGWAP
jgi:hypothetical protein